MVSSFGSITGKGLPRKLLLVIGLVAFLLAITSTTLVRSQAQPDLLGYWRYTSSGRLSKVLPADIDRNGIDEFLLVDENDHVDLVSASGKNLWTFIAPDAVTSIGAVNVEPGGDFTPAVVLGMPNQLIMLSPEGSERWRVAINPLDIQSNLSGVDETIPGQATVRGSDALPVAIMPVRWSSPDEQQILVMLQSGELLLFNTDGQEVWRNADHLSADIATARPKLLVADLDGDEQDEIVLAVFNVRRFGQLVLIDEGRVLWDVPLSRSVTDIKAISFGDDGQSLIAVSTTSGHIQIFDYLRRRHWLRTLNTPATSLAVLPLPDGTVLAAGTSSGSITVFDEQGRRLWAINVAEDGEEAVLNLEAAPVVLDEREPVLVATLQDAGATSDSVTVLLNGLGNPLGRIDGVDPEGLTRFVDSNRDLISELLISRFATMELVGIGAGKTGNVREWEYSLNAAPGAHLITDLEGDGDSELVVGTLDGRVHNLSEDRTLNWLHDTGGSVQYLAALPHFDGGNESIVIAGNREKEDGQMAGWIQLRDGKGERVWEHLLEAPLTAFLVADALPGTDPEIVAGTEDGNLIVLSSLGEQLQELVVFLPPQPIQHLAHMLSAVRPTGELIVGGSNDLLGITLGDSSSTLRRLNSFSREISSLYAYGKPGNPTEDVRLLVATGEGTLHGLNAMGEELTRMGWPVSVASRITDVALVPTGARASSESSPTFILSTARGALYGLDILEGRPIKQWDLQGLGEIVDVHRNSEIAPGQANLFVIGNTTGDVIQFESAESESPQPLGPPLSVTSAVFAVETLLRDNSQTPALLIIGQNGLLQLFRDQENRPPLLTDPVAATEGGQYRISVAVNDVEGDEVAATLEVQEPETGVWMAQGTQRLSEGEGTLLWALAAPPESPEGVQYRFIFSDGSNSGTLTPPAGPPAEVATPWSGMVPVALTGILIAGLVLGLAYIRQAQTPNARAARLYQLIKEQPTKTLRVLEAHVGSGGANDLVLHMASRARQENDKAVATLADGLFLLPEQPLSGVPILNRVLNELVENGSSTLEGLPDWQRLLQTSQALLEAPSTTELSLLLPQLEQLVAQLRLSGDRKSPFELVVPILIHLRDSERVDLVDDRLVYLNEAVAAVRKVQSQLPSYEPSLEHLLVGALLRRWSGLVSAEIADMHGRAELAVSLKTRRLAPLEQTTLAFELYNGGRSIAENVRVFLDSSPAYAARQQHEEIGYLPPGKTRELRFTISPQVEDYFRVSLSLSYDDYSERNRTMAFADMVHILPPVRDFTPIENPYTPGTPLRQNSLLFYGREELFEFVAENTGQRSHRNVLILVGQRRSGKTSALLRLEDRLPDDLLPVYIDCQSLGVVPGMPALLEEIAWYICDALSKRGLHVAVPDIDAWQRDPTRLFQREFLPQANALLPDDTTLILVFDEFEAFESLVAAGILPPTFFTYLRHLMQHSDQLNFIFVGTRRLEEMTTDYWSVLFNIALYRKIGFLDSNSATRLITEPVAPKLVYDDLAIDKILRVTAGHPYFLQLVCYALVKRANLERRGYITISDVNAALDEMLSLGEVHFAYLWKRSTMAERAILATVAHLMDQTAPFHPEQLIQQLKPFDIYLHPTETTRALNSLAERDILREVTEEGKSLYEIKLGLVSLWVAKNKSLSKLYAEETANRKAQPHGESV